MIVRRKEEIICKVFGAGITGIEAYCVTVEVYMSRGIGFSLVGLPDSAVRESQQRIEIALKRCGFILPGRNIVINMAPAGVRKEGSGFDLAIAVGILSASRHFHGISSSSGSDFHEIVLDDYIIMGELSLDGSIRDFSGAMVIAASARDLGFKGCIFPRRSALECACLDGDTEIYGVESLRDVLAILNDPASEASMRMRCHAQYENSSAEEADCGPCEDDIAFIKGQTVAKTALEIAAAGGHNLILYGTPGCGKTMLAKSLRTIMPPMTKEESITTGKIYSVSANSKVMCGLPKERPFRAPHHTATLTSLLGGGSGKVCPGEISLAHNGILFLDEFAEFPRRNIEALRKPLEERSIQLSRMRNKVTYPASFILVAAMNPCPCGYYNSGGSRCTCSSAAISRYLSRVSGPILDRIDLHVYVGEVRFDDLSGSEYGESSRSVRERVIKARHIQEERFRGCKEIRCNAQMPHIHINEYIEMERESVAMMQEAVKRLSLSARAYGSVLKVARTVADLCGSVSVKPGHIATAIGYRSSGRLV